MDKSKKPGMTVLIPEQEVCGHTIRPWTLAQAIELAEDFDGATRDIVAAGLTMDQFQKDPMIVVKAIAPRLTRFIGVTIGVSAEEASELPMGDATLIALTIVRQNLNHLKNLLGPASEVLQDLAQSMSSGNSSGPSKPSSAEGTPSEPSSTSTG
jgi:hypothetical protein